MNLRKKTSVIITAIVAVFFVSTIGYGFYSGMFSASADAMSSLIENKYKSLPNCSTKGICVSITDNAQNVRPGDSLNYVVKVVNTSNQFFEVDNNFCPFWNRNCEDQYFITKVIAGSVFSFGSHIIFPSGETTFNVTEHVSTIQKPGTKIFAYIYLAGNFSHVDSNYGYGYGYGQDKNNIKLFASDEDTVVPNNPKLLSTSPANNEINVLLNSKIKANFDGIASDYIISVNKGDVKGSTSFENNYKTIVFTPSSTLASNTNYTVVVTRPSTGDTISWLFTTKKVIAPALTMYYPTGDQTVFNDSILVYGVVRDQDTPIKDVAVTINGQKVTVVGSQFSMMGGIGNLGQAGAINYTAKLQIGTNKITIVAKDPDGATDTKTYNITRKSSWLMYWPFK